MEIIHQLIGRKRVLLWEKLAWWSWRGNGGRQVLGT
jgi:hypothetical protein